MLHRFFTLPQYQKAVDALCNMYAAANTVFEKDEHQLRGDEQKMMYAGERASGFKVTPPLNELIEDIDTAVTGEWKKRHLRDVPEAAKDAFVDIITRRKDQPLN